MKEESPISRRSRADHDPLDHLEDHRLGWFWTWGALVIAICFLPLGVALINLSLNREDTPPKGEEFDWAQPAFFTLGLVFVLTGAALNVANQIVRSRATNREAELRKNGVVSYNDELVPVLEVLQELLDSDRSRGSGDRFFRSVLSEARNLIPLNGVRLCVYRLEDLDEPTSDDSEPSEGDLGEPAATLSHPSGAPPKYLALAAHRGRGDPPRLEFRPDDDYGQALIAIAQGSHARTVDNVGEASFPVDRSEDTVWKSYIAIPIRREHSHLGVLTVDVRDETHFTHEHVSIGWTISRFLSIGMDAMNRGGLNTKPEVDTMLEGLRVFK